MGRARQIANADEMGRILLDASDTGTDVGEHLLLDASAAGTDVGFFVNVEEGTGTGDGGVSNFNALQGTLDLTSQVTGALGIANGGTALSSGFLNGLTFYETMRLRFELRFKFIIIAIAFTFTATVTDTMTNIIRFTTEIKIGNSDSTCLYRC